MEKVAVTKKKARAFEIINEMEALQIKLDSSELAKNFKKLRIELAKIKKELK